MPAAQHYGPLTAAAAAAAANNQTETMTMMLIDYNIDELRAIVVHCDIVLDQFDQC